MTNEIMIPDETSITNFDKQRKERKPKTTN